ncbi:MAG: hypothetical protein GX605_03085, partial [Chloroflexi bacterium]|nr:hypothetical protein [Chloroflexota bacterium]
MSSAAHMVYPGVVLGEGVQIGPYSLIGLPTDEADGESRQTVIGDGVSIGAHCVVEAGASLGAGVRLGHGTVIGGDAAIADGCTVGAHCHLDHVRLAEEIEVQDQVVMGIVPLEKYDFQKLGSDWPLLVEIGPRSVIRSHSSIYAKVRAGARFNCGHGARIRECTQIGEGATFGTNSQADGFV